MLNSRREVHSKVLTFAVHYDEFTSSGGALISTQPSEPDCYRLIGPLKHWSCVLKGREKTEVRNYDIVIKNIRIKIFLALYF